MSGWGAAIGAGVGLAGDLLGKDPKAPKTEPWKPVAQGLESNYLPLVQDFSDAYGGGQGLWNQNRLGGLDPNTTAGQDAMLAMANQFGGQNQSLIGANQGFIDYDPNSPVNQARRSAFREQGLANFNQNLVPAIQDQSTFAGQYGGDQQRGQIGEAAAGVARDLNSMEAQMMESDRNRAQAAIAQQTQLLNNQFVPGQVQMAVGDQRTAREQLGLEDQIQLFEAARTNQLRGAQDVGNLYQPFTGMSQSGGSLAGSNPFQSAAGGALLGSQLYKGGNPFAGIFSNNQSPEFNPQGSSGSGSLGGMDISGWG